VLGVLGALVTSACREAPEPRVGVLSAGFVPDASTRRFKLEAPIEAESWRPLGEPGLWVAPDPFADCDLPRLRSGHPRLLVKGQAVPYEGETPDEPPTAFEVTDGRVRLRWRGADGERPPRALFELPLAAGRVAPSSLHEAQRALVGERWRLYHERLASDAIPLVPGQVQTTPAAEVAPGSRLSFRTSCVGPPAAEPARLTVSLGDEVVATLPLEVAPQADLASHSVELPRGGASLAVSFALAGPPCFVAVHTPVVAPPGLQRKRPDIVLFLADTFRADNLACYGGREEVAPNLNRFADAGLRFRRVWAPAAWTLPSHASMFLGLQPHQHGTYEKLKRLDERLVTLAEWLQVAGYRTGAVTNGAYVSWRYGMDRGFEWFEERQPLELEGTLSAARAFLETDDPRPAFLFVHTYRVHGPYRVSDATLAEHGASLGLRDGIRAQRELVQAIRSMKVDGPDADPELERSFRKLNLEGAWLQLMRSRIASRGIPSDDVEAEVHHTARSLHDLYLGGVCDLDRSFGTFLADLEEQGRGPSDAFFLFTSDHGEAFGEHEALFHGRGVWDELLRIPLIVRGPGVESGWSDATGTLVDLPRTISALLGIPPAPGWGGRSLLDDPVDHAIAFDCAEADPSAVVLDGRWKIALPADADRFAVDEATLVYDREADPGERRNLAEGRGAEASWREALERRFPDLQAALEPIGEAGDVEADPKLLRELGKLGYMDVPEDD